jgi:hypothetical protein
MRWVKRIAVVLVAVLVGLTAALVGLIGYVSWKDEASQRAYFNARPIAKSMRESTPLNGPNSPPARDAFLRLFPIGSDMGDALAALAGEGFHCRLMSQQEVAESQVRCRFQESPNLYIVIFPMVWTLHLGFDKSNRLEHVRVDKIPMAA